MHQRARAQHARAHSRARTCAFACARAALARACAPALSLGQCSRIQLRMASGLSLPRACKRQRRQRRCEGRTLARCAACTDPHRATLTRHSTPGRSREKTQGHVRR
eukprot:6206686-Pleurochrysis_carterae.AAC.1